MSGVNKVILIGRLGQDPETRYTSNGSAVANFSLATSENWTDKSGQRQERTEWHRVVVWGKLAELCNQYLKKGRQAFIEGKLQTRSWDDRDGNKRYTTEIVATTVQFLGGAQQGAGDFGGQDSYGGGMPQQQPTQNGFGGGAPQAAPQQYDVSSDSSFAADDIPF